MALTDVFISPAGAGDNSGSSVANALPAISSGDWSTNIEGLDRANKRFVFLTGTYDCTTTLTFSGSAPAATTPNQWVGADSNGNILRPKYDESGLRLDTTNYPKFVCSTNTAMIDTEEQTYYKCLSFENTNTGYSQVSIIDITIGDTDQQVWVGCEFKATHARNSSAVVITSAGNTNFHDCVFEMPKGSGYSQFQSVLRVTTNVMVDNCRIIGPAGPADMTVSTGGDQNGIEITAVSSKLRNCVVTKVKGVGVLLDSTNAKSEIDVAQCTICDIGDSGIVTNLASSSSAPGKGTLEGNIIFDCSNFGIETSTDDSKQSGAQILAMGSNDNGNFSHLDSYEDMIDVIAITTAEFFDYNNQDFRIRRDSPLYKFYGTRNFGAIQNEDFEFDSVG